MSDNPSLPRVPSTAISERLATLAAQFRKASTSFPEWRHRYYRSAGQPSEQWISVILGCPDDPRYNAVLELAQSQRNVMGDMQAERQLGMHEFQDLTCQTWALLPTSFKGEHDDPTDGWFAVIYDWLAGTPLVAEYRGNLCGLCDIRELTVNAFEASATAIELILADWGVSPACSSGNDAVHSPDFRSVNWFGEEHTFTPNQAAVIKVLWENWNQGTAEVGDQYLLEAADSSGNRLDLVFRGHRAWGTMIVGGNTKGTRRLAEPSK